MLLITGWAAVVLCTAAGLSIARLSNFLSQLCPPGEALP